jgi:hypothetical protein
VLVQVTTRTVTISLVFGGFGSAVPYLLVRRLAAKRRADLREVWPEIVDDLASRRLFIPEDAGTVPASSVVTAAAVMAGGRWRGHLSVAIERSGLEGRSRTRRWPGRRGS